MSELARRGSGLLLVIAAAGCSGGEAAMAPEPPRALPVSISGAVTDSLTGAGVADAMVTTEIGTAITDAAGRFTVLAPSHDVRLRVLHIQYELRTLRRTVREGALLHVPVVPLAPVVRGCRLSDGRTWTLIADLQGRKTIVRRDSSGVMVGEEDARRFIAGHRFDWWAVDDHHWIMEGPAVTAEELAGAEWRIFDTDGNLRPHRCGRAEVPVRQASAATALR
jgi:hypothetical protein